MATIKLSRQEKFNKILDEGRTLFAKYGHGMSMRELASNAGFGGVSSLYRYISNKRELWFAVANRDVLKINTQLEQVMLDPTLVTNQAILKAMISFFLKFSREEFNKFRVSFLMEPPEADVIGGEHEQLHNPKIYQNFFVIIQRGVGVDEFSDPNLIMMVGMIWSIMMGAAISLSPLYDFMGDKLIPAEIRQQLGGDPVILLHEEAVKKIEQLYFS